MNAAQIARVASAVLALLLSLGLVMSSAAAQGEHNQADLGRVDARTISACSPIIIGTGGNVTVNNNCPIGLSQQDLERIREAVRGGLAIGFVEQISGLSARLGVTRTALENFFRLLGEQQVPDADLDARLRELAARYLRFSQILASVGSPDPGIQSLRTALERGDVVSTADAVRGLEARLAAEGSQVTAERASARAAIRDIAEQVRRRGIRAGGVLVSTTRWLPGSTLRFCFLDGDAEQRRRVASVAREWSLYANLDLDFGLRDLPRDCSTQTDVRALLRITLNGQGNWSYIGTDAHGIPPPQPQISIMFPLLQNAADPAELNRTILHEFGHVLGFIHAFSNPKARCAEQLDPDRARQWAAAFGWDLQTLQRNLKAPSPESVMAGDVDSESVMTYVLPAKIFKAGAARDCIHTPGPGLSLGDKLAALAIYP